MKFARIMWRFMNIVCVHTYIDMIVIINKICSLSCSESLTLFILVLSYDRKDYALLLNHFYPHCSASRKSIFWSDDRSFPLVPILFILQRTNLFVNKDLPPFYQSVGATWNYALVKKYSHTKINIVFSIIRWNPHVIEKGNLVGWPIAFTIVKLNRRKTLSEISTFFLMKIHLKSCLNEQYWSSH
jgi:hypothetical protein